MLTLRSYGECGRFGGLQALQSGFFFPCGGGAASAAREKEDSGEAKPPQTPPLRKVSYCMSFFAPAGRKKTYKELKMTDKRKS